MKIVVVGDLDDVIGFSLAGVQETYYVTPDEEDRIRSIVESLASRKDVAIVVMTPEIYDKVRDLVTEFAKEKTFPVFLDLPREGVLKSLEDLVSKALGVKMKFE